MLKNVLIATLALSLFSIARADDLSRRLQDQSDEVRSLLYSRAHTLSTQTQRQILEQLRSIQILVDRDSGGGGRPGRRPQPPSYVHSIRGKIERNEFSFEGENLQEFFNQCTAFVRTNGLGAVDDISVSLNFGEIVTLKNSRGYWAGGNETCLQLNEVLSSQGIPAERGDVILIGRVERTDFVFRGRTISELNSQCESFIRSTGNAAVDDILISVNMESARVLKNSRGYWRGAFEICQQILQQR